MASEEKSCIVEFNGRLEDCVLLVKHPYVDSIHPWYANGAFIEFIAERGEAPLGDERGRTVGYTRSLLRYVSNYFENLLFHEGECLLMGVAHIDEFTTPPPTKLFQNITTMEDWT